MTSIAPQASRCTNGPVAVCPVAVCPAAPGQPCAGPGPPRVRPRTACAANQHPVAANVACHSPAGAKPSPGTSIPAIADPISTWVRSTAYPVGRRDRHATASRPAQ